MIQGWGCLLGTGSGASNASTSAMGVRMFSFDPPSIVGCLVVAFLLSEECCDATLDFAENFESRDVFPVDCRGTDDLPLLLTDSALVEGEDSGVSSVIPLSTEMTLGLLLN